MATLAYRILHNMTYGRATNAIIQGLYYRSMYQITLCNNFIQQATDAQLAKNNITGADAANIKLYAAEARFIRAYQYWVLMDIFGNPPFVTDATAIVWFCYSSANCTVRTFMLML